MTAQPHAVETNSLTSGMMPPADVTLGPGRSPARKILEALAADSAKRSRVGWRVTCTFSSTTQWAETEHVIQADSATGAEGPNTDDDTPYRSAQAAFGSAEDEFFEDGTESQFAREIKVLIAKHRRSALEAISHLILFTKTGPHVANEALSTLGAVSEPTTYEYRRWLLERTLGSPSAVVRDGAVIGLAWLDDPHAIPYVQRAVQGEQLAPLRRSMEQLAGQLGEKSRWRSS